MDAAALSEAAELTMSYAGERTRGRSSPSTEPGSGKSVLRIAVRSREVTATRGVAGVEDFGRLKEGHYALSLKNGSSLTPYGTGVGVTWQASKSKPLLIY